MRKFLFAILLLLGSFLIFAQIAEIEAILGVVRQGDLRFLWLAILAQVAWTFTMAAVFQRIYRELGMKESLGRLTLLVLSAFSVSVVAPTGGLGGLVVLIADARRRNLSTARVTLAGALYIIFDYAALLLVLALGLIVLIRRNNLEAGEIAASVILLLIFLFLAVLIYLGMVSGNALERFLVFGVRSVNRVLTPFQQFGKRTQRVLAYLSEDRARFFARETHEGLLALHGRLDYILPPLVLALCAKGLLICVLFLCFLSFRIPFSIGTLIAGYSIGNLFVIVSPTPSGVGVMEGVMVLALRSLNVPLSGATVITLAYRGITFWLPLLGGILAMRWLTRHESS